MMLKAKKISAVSIALTDGVEAVFVQRGGDWNSMREYTCIAPGAFLGQTIITAPDPSLHGGMLSMVFDGLFGRLDESIIVMASPDLGAAIKAVNAATAQAA